MVQPRPRTPSWTANALTLVMWIVGIYVLLIALISVLAAS